MSKKNLAVDTKSEYDNFVYMCLRIQSMMELNQKLTKTLDTESLHMGKDLCKNLWGLKRKEGVCSMGAHFRELMVILTRNDLYELQLPFSYFKACAATLAVRT